MLSFKDKAYDYFDSAIDLLKGRKGVKEIGMLSSFYGGKMSYLMTDSLYEDASVMALEREKQIKKLETLPDVPKGLVDMQYGYLYSKWAYNCYMERNMGRLKSTLRCINRLNTLVHLMEKCIQFLICWLPSITSR